MQMTTAMMGGGFFLLVGSGIGLFAQQAETSAVVEQQGGAANEVGIETVPMVEAWPGTLGAPPPEAAAAPPASPAVDLAICLDTSGSMRGLIDATKQKLWAIVNDLALAEPLPRLRVALLTYGNNGHTPENGWVRIDAGLTEDLDMISERLFALTTNGGEEYVGRVVMTAATDLDWTTSVGALKLIVVAGNESADQDPVTPYSAASAAAIGRDIMVNAIYCGNPADDLAPAWREVAKLADGQFASIDHDAGTVTIVTPFDDQLTALSASVNGTYVPFGANGAWAFDNQCRQDMNAVGLNSEAAASRAELKSKKLYVTDWDLVTACADGKVTLAELAVEELPEVMREMTIEERTAYLGENGLKRAEIQAQIDAVAAQRRAFIDQELLKEGNDESRAFDFVLRQAIQDQARKCGFQFAAPAAPPQPVPPAQPAAPEVTPTPSQGATGAPPAPSQQASQQRRQELRQQPAPPAQQSAGGGGV